MTVKGFERRPSGEGGLYDCGGCGKQTRDTGHGERSVDLCRACFVTATIENDHFDNGHEAIVKGCPQCKKGRTE